MVNAPHTSAPTADEELLTTAEVAQICRAPVSTVRYWRHIGFGPVSFRLGRRVVYRRADVARWIHNRANHDVVAARSLPRSTRA